MKMRPRITFIVVALMWWFASCALAQQCHYPTAQRFAIAPDNLVKYTVSIKPINDRTDLYVRFSFSGDASGKTGIRIPTGRFGTPAIEKSFKDISIKGARIHTQAKKSNTLLLTHDPNSAITINYRVTTDPKQNQGAYRPSTSNSHFHYFGSQWRISFDEPDIEREYRFEFADIPKDWVVYSNLGSGQGPYTFKATDDAVSGFIAGGNYEKARIDVQGTPIEIHVSKSFAQSSEIIKSAEAIVRRQGKIFGGFDREFFVISMSPRKSLRAGVAINNAFVCFVDPKTSATEMDVLIAHEAFHNWLPGKGTVDLWKNGSSEDEFRLDWFVEGFTEYIARKMLLESGRLSMDEFVEKFNGDLREQARNPMQRASLSVVRKAIKDQRYTNYHERTSYFRGPLIALMVEHQLKKSGKTTLIDIVQEFLSEAAKTNGVIKEQAFFDLFAKHEVDLRAIYRDSIVYGNPVLPHPDVFGANYTVQKVNISRVEQSFDALFSRLSGKIQGVEIDGKAYRAGLRDGMIHVKTELSRAKNRPTKVNVKSPFDRSSQNQTIEFLPTFIESTTLRFVPVGQ